jgi:hypothetical protein
MAQDVAQLTERYLSSDPSQWARLASTVQFRRLQVLLLRAILVELRKLNGSPEADPADQGAS